MNDYFAFKEFTVQQGDCAMKVCTDACIQGAWTAVQLHREKNILDIGTGTGLLSLMLAQNSQAIITAIEIDRSACKEAAQNFNASKWKSQFNIIHSSLQQFSPEENFDLIISNPPFYSNDLHSPENLKNIAMHSTELTLVELITSINKMLSENGKACVMVPYTRLSELEEIIEQYKLSINQMLLIKQTPKHSFFRAIMILSKIKSDIKTEELIIKENEHYTSDFIQLLKPYYLNL